MRFIHYTDPRHSYRRSFRSHIALFSYDLLRPAQLSQTLFDFKRFIWSHCQVSALSSSLTVFQQACVFSHTSSLLTTFFWSHYLTPLNIMSACRLSPPVLAWVVILVFPSLLSCLSSPRSLRPHRPSQLSLFPLSLLPSRALSLVINEAVCWVQFIFTE